MNSCFVAISTLVKSDIREKCLLNFLINMPAQSLKNYLECENISKGTSPKKKTGLVEMIVYRCITDKLNKIGVEDISKKQGNQILNKTRIIIKSLPGYGNVELKKKDIKPSVTEKPFLKIWAMLNKIVPPEIFINNNAPHPKYLLTIMFKIKDKYF